MQVRRSIVSWHSAWLIFGVVALTATNPLRAQTTPQEDSGEGDGAALSPLAAKEEMAGGPNLNSIGSPTRQSGIMHPPKCPE